VDFFAVDFLAVRFRAVDFLAVDLRAVDFFLAVDFLAVAFFAVRLRAVDFLAVDFFAVDLRAVDLRAVDFFAVRLAAVLRDELFFVAALAVVFFAGTLPPRHTGPSRVDGLRSKRVALLRRTFHNQRNLLVIVSQLLFSFFGTLRNHSLW
jgi:hypothetical protein